MSNPKSLKNVVNQYNDQNIGFKVFYHGSAMLDVNLNLDYHIFILKNDIVALLHYVIYTLTTGTSGLVTSFHPMSPAKRWGIEVLSFKI